MGRTSTASLALSATGAMFSTGLADVIQVPEDQPTIRAAIDIAEDGDVIEIAAGIYTPENTIDPLGKAVTLRGEVDKNGSPITTIDGQGEIRILNFESGEGPDTVLENLLITGGYSSSGSGMLCDGATPTLNNCVFFQNHTETQGRGGGMYCVNGDPILTNCAFRDNHATFGGAMYLYTSSAMLTDCLIEENTARTGAGIYCSYSDLTITDNTFRSNSAYNDGSGAGMYIQGSISPTLNGCLFELNSSTGDGWGVGGGIYVNYSSPNLNECIFRENSADYAGGGILFFYSDATLNDCLFLQNSGSNFGGGIAAAEESNPTITNCVFQENTVGEALYGGGLFCEGGSLPTLTSTAICQNTPDQVYGIYINNIGNCIASSCVDDDGDGIPDECGDGEIDILQVPSKKYPTISSAIAAAGYRDVIEISAGTHLISEPLSPLGKAITLRGATDANGYPTTILDGQDANRVLECTQQENAETVFENLLITGGQADDGGGLHCSWYGRPTLNNCVFLQNAASNEGGALYCEYNSSPTLNDCVFQENSAAYGGGIHSFSFSNPTLTNCVFQANSASHDGGGMNCVYQSNAILTDCIFQENVAVNGGGGIHSSASSMALSSCMFQANSASNGGGMFSTVSNVITDSVFCGNEGGNIWGTWTDDGGNCLRNACQDNDGDGVPDCDGIDSDLELSVPDEYPTIELAMDAAAPGAVIDIAAGTYAPPMTLDPLGKPMLLRGAIDLNGNPTTIIDGQDAGRVFQCTSDEDATTTFENLVITRGQAANGGGMYCQSSSPTLNNCVFLENTALDGGGGLYCRYQGSQPILNDCRFEANSAIDGGGVHCADASDPNLNNCRILENSATGSGGGLYGGTFSIPLLTQTILCGNTPDQIFSEYSDNGGNCISYSCIDADENGIPDKCGDTDIDILTVPSDAYPTIASAIAAAGYGDIIEIAAGTWLPDATLNTQGKRLILRGSVDADGYPTTIIDGRGGIRVLQCSSGEDAETIFENLLITGGQAERGGGMYCNFSSPTLSNCVFKENSATGSQLADGGGGLYCDRSASPTLNNCGFEQNSSTRNGGGIYCDSYSNTTLIDCVLRGNSALTGSGGGAHFRSSSTASLVNCRFDENSAYAGGGMFCDSREVILEGCTFESNSAVNGGGLLNDSSLTLNNCVFEANSASEDGGGMYNESYPELNDCVFLMNSATRGGGMYSDYSDNPTLTNCMFMENSAVEDGGGMYCHYGSDPTLINCVFQANAANKSGGGLYCDTDSESNLTDTILCGNVVDQIRGSFNDNGGNCISQACSLCGLTECPTDLNGDGVTDGEDLGLFFVQWGECLDCSADLNGDGEVDGQDLGLLFVGWGPCG